MRSAKAPCIVIFLTLIITSVGCRKENGSPVPVGNGTSASSHIELAMDSACVQAPNVITPNADGINDIFIVLALNINSLSFQIRNAAGEEVFAHNGIDMAWDGTDTTGTGPYRVYVQALSTSGNMLYGESRLDVLDYGTGNCLVYSGTPVCGDQLDPNVCGISYTSNDIFCP
jgi:hypothetical protein